MIAETCKQCETTFHHRSDKPQRYCSPDCKQQAVAWITKQCEQCGKDFEHQGGTPRRHCSMACRRTANQVTKQCEKCGKSFTRKPSMAGRFCSRSCAPGRPRHEGNYVTKICPGCNEPFTCSVHRETEYCNRACRSMAALRERECPSCGETFTYQRSWPRIHCSARCYGEAMGQGGKIYYGGNWAAQRQHAIDRDGGCCVDCGTRLKTPHVHHLRAVRSFDGDWRAANDLDNLVTVCKPCHLARHEGVYSPQRR